MLKISKISNRFQVQNFLDTFDPETTTWIVSDLNSKLSTQKFLLNKFGSLEEISVLRASDFWKLLLRRAAPTKRLVSIDFASGLMRKFMDSSDELRLSGRSDQTLLTYMQALSPIVLNANGQSIMADWFQENPAALDKWGDWYARSLVGHLYLEKNDLLCVNWIASFVHNRVEFRKFWSRNLIFDLGPELSSVEADIIKSLSEVCDVLVMQPSPEAEWVKRFDFLLKPYSDLTTAKSKTLPSIEGKNLFVNSGCDYLRFSSALAEVKDTTAKVRKYLDDGVAPEKILVVAPDIEEYWPLLQMHFQFEGIPVSKDLCSKLSSLPAIQRWIAQLKLAIGQMDVNDLELAYYLSRGKDLLRSEEFKSTFNLLFEPEDLNREQKIADWFSQTNKIGQELSRNEFASVILSFWDSSDSLDYLEISLREILATATQTDTLPASQWISYLEKLMAKKEITLQKGLRGGVQVSSLMSGQDSNAEVRFFLGLSDEALRGSTRTAISFDDQQKLSEVFGAVIDSSSQDFKDFELRWQADAGAAYDCFSFSAANPLGDLQTPSSFWIEGVIAKSKANGASENFRHELEKVQLHEDCLLDQKLALSESLPVSTFVDLPITGPIKVSASNMEEYLKCPFRFAAASVFKLKDLSDSDMDVDARTGGSFSHALFEKLTKKPMRYDWSELELKNLIEEIKIEVKLQMADKRMWQSTSEKYLKTAKKFLEFEKQWRNEYPSTETIFAEYPFEFKWDEKAKSREPSGQILIKGKIDRVDWNRKDSVVLIDYKSSLSQKKSFRKWLDNSDVQLLFYLWVFENHLKQEFSEKGMAVDVAGAFYYGFRDFERTKKGIKIGEDDLDLLPKPKSKKGFGATEQEYLDLLNAFQMKFEEFISSLRKGSFKAQPSDEKICDHCEWRQVCRAEHLR